MRAVASSRAKLLLESLDYYFRYFHHWYWFCYSEDDFCQLYLLLLFSYCFITIIHFMIATSTTTAVILFILISFPSYVDNVTLSGKIEGFSCSLDKFENSLSFHIIFLRCSSDSLKLYDIMNTRSTLKIQVARNEWHQTKSSVTAEHLVMLAGTSRLLKSHANFDTLQRGERHFALPSTFMPDFTVNVSLQRELDIENKDKEFCESVKQRVFLFEVNYGFYKENNYIRK